MVVVNRSRADEVGSRRTACLALEGAGDGHVASLADREIDAVERGVDVPQRALDSRLPIERQNMSNASCVSAWIESAHRRS